MEKNEVRPASSTADINQNYYVREQLEYVNNPGTRRGWKRRYDFACQHVRKGDTVLDCGCGLGQGTHLLWERCGNAVGVDIDTRFIEYCTQHCRDCRFLCLDVAHGLPFEDSSFDVVVAIELLEHMPSNHAVKRTLSHINRVLKPGGFFIASAPNRTSRGGKALYRRLKQSILKIAGRYIKKQARWHEQFFLWTPESFRSVLQPYFETVSVFGQWSEGITQDAANAPYLLARARKRNA